MTAAPDMVAQAAAELRRTARLPAGTAFIPVAASLLTDEQLAAPPVRGTYRLIAGGHPDLPQLMLSRDADPLPPTNDVSAETALGLLRVDCDYDPDGAGGLDDLIAYKDALEDLVREHYPKAAAWERMSEALNDHAKNGTLPGHVCAVGLAIQESLR